MIIIENNMQIFKKFLETQRPMVRVGNQDISIFEFDRCHFVVGIPVDKIYYTLYCHSLTDNIQYQTLCCHSLKMYTTLQWNNIWIAAYGIKES